MLDPNEMMMGIFRHLWPLFLLFGLLLLGAYARYLYRQHRLSAAGLPEIDRMTGKDFESRMAVLFKMKGYRVDQTPYVGDLGADLIIVKNAERTVAQIKRWNHKVGVRAVQEVVAAKAKYGCTRALVATNALFTDAALHLARVNQVELWDRHRLAGELLALSRSESSGRTGRLVEVQKPAAAPLGDPVPVQSRPRCYKCGREMVLRENARGKFWACPGFPACRNTFAARTPGPRAGAASAG
jgi:restriction system protein